MSSTHPITLLLDGATGTALLGRGLPPGARPDEWVLARPEEVRTVHAGHVAAGAQVVLTCTFSLGRSADPAALARAAVRLAREAGAARVAGAVGPEGDLGAAFGALALAGADLLWAETHWDLSRARLALAAARTTGLPAVVTVAFTDGERPELPGGGAVEEALRTLAADGAAAVGVNCVAPSDALARLVARVAPALGVPFVAKPSPGLPGSVLPPEAFADRVRPLVEAGAAWVGGCCGATAEHVAALAVLRGP